MKKDGHARKWVYILSLVCLILLTVGVSALLEVRAEEADRVARTNLLHIQNYARTIYKSGEDYEQVCEDTSIMQAFLAAEQAGGGRGECNSSLLGWAISVPLRKGGYFCVDFEGKDIHRGSILGIDVRC